MNQTRLQEMKEISVWTLANTFYAEKQELSANSEWIQKDLVAVILIETVMHLQSI